MRRSKESPAQSGFRRARFAAVAALFAAGAVVWGADKQPQRGNSRGEAVVKDDGAAMIPAIELEVSEEAANTQLPVDIDEFDPVLADRVEASRRETAAMLSNGKPGGLSVLVHFDPALDRGRSAPGPARLGVRQYAALKNAKVQYEYDILPNVVNVRGVTKAQIEELRAMPGVIRIEEDTIHQIVAHDSMPLIGGLESQKSAAGLSARGTGARVCIIDTGIRADHIMFTGRIDAAAGWDYFNNDSDPNDDNGHGTNVAGIAAGGDGFSVNLGTCGPKPFQGVAPGATIIAVKVCSGGGSCPTSSIVAGINRCASPTLPGGQADVINLSLGGGQFSGTCDSDSSAAACNNASNAGVTVVASAGNNGFSNALGSPACGSQVIAVGATYDSSFPNCQDSNTSFTWCLNSFCTSTCTDNPIVQDNRVCFSNRSVNLDVAAPGSVIWSASNAGASSIVGYSGTSQASPHVAGLATLIVGMDPSLTPAEVRQIVRDGAIDLGAAGFDTNYGYGRIDVINSLNLVAPPPGCTSNAQCDDGLWCNGAEICNAGTCQAGSAPNCNDGVACTDDSCNESTDSCNNVANNGNCDDGLFCNGEETCHATLGCQAGSDPCAPDPCNEITDTCGGGGDNRELWVSFQNNASVPGVGVVANEDIVVYSYATGTWSMMFDGSDVGIASLSIVGLSVQDNGDLLMSFQAAGTVPGLIGGPSGTTVDDSDIVRFVPTTLGPSTSGTFFFYFDGSDVGLSSNSEDIDAIAVHADGRLIVSTTGSFTATGASGADEDLIIFNATSLGAATAGNFSMFFDGSDVGLSNSSSEDVDSARYTVNGTLLLSTIGPFSVNGASGDDEDLFEFFPGQYGSTTTGTFAPYESLTNLGISASEDVNAISVVWR